MKISKGLASDLRRALANTQYEITDGGICIGSFMFGGRYEDRVIRGGEVIEFGSTDNLVVDQGMIDILNTYFGTTSKKAGFYVALFAGAVTPAANWTAASFTATASEITSGTEGYSQTTRPAWVTPNASTPQIDNYAAKAAFSIVTASSLNVNGAAILSDQAKGSTGGVLVSAARYSNTRVLQNGDTYEVGYRIVASPV